MKKPKVGQTVYFYRNDNAKEAEELEVTKVGRKYFYCGNSRPWKEERAFHLSDWKEKNWPYSGVVYPSKQARRDEMEAAQICRDMENYFQYGGPRNKISLEKLRQIKAIVESVN